MGKGDAGRGKGGRCREGQKVEEKGEISDFTSFKCNLATGFL